MWIRLGVERRKTLGWVLGYLFSFSVNYLLILHFFSALYFACVMKTINIHVFRNK